MSGAVEHSLACLACGLSLAWLLCRFLFLCPFGFANCCLYLRSPYISLVVGSSLPKLASFLSFFFLSALSLRSVDRRTAQRDVIVLACSGSRLSCYHTHLPFPFRALGWFSTSFRVLFLSFFFCVLKTQSRGSPISPRRHFFSRSLSAALLRFLTD